MVPVPSVRRKIGTEKYIPSLGASSASVKCRAPATTLTWRGSAHEDAHTLPLRDVGVAQKETVGAGMPTGRRSQSNTTALTASGIGHTH